MLDEIIDLAPVPLLLGALDAVEPDTVDAPVIGAQFLDLADVIGEVRGPVGGVTGAVILDVLECTGSVDEIAVVPVGLGVVEDDAHVGAMARLDEFSDEVAAEARVGDLVVGESRVEEAEAVMVLGGDCDIAASALLCCFDPPVGIEAFGVEAAGEFLILLAGDVLVVHDPFATTEECVETEMDEHAHFGVVEPLQFRIKRRFDDHWRSPLACVPAPCRVSP